LAVKVKRSFVPAYYQVADDLSREIEAGRLRPGDVIPSESQLCVRYGISRMTVRQGLGLLGEADYIRSVPGKGCFVSAPRLDRIALEFREGLLGDGRRLEPELVGVEVIAADAEVAEHLLLTEAGKVVEFRRLSHLGAKPVAFEQKYLPYVKGRPLVEQEIRYAAFPAVVARSCEMHLVKVRMTMYAGRASAEAAAKLPLDEHGICMVLEQSVLDQDDQVLGWGRTYCLPEEYRLTAESDPFWNRL
jgi:GntR family transcriptional regulator